MNSLYKKFSEFMFFDDDDDNDDDDDDYDILVDASPNVSHQSS